MFRWMLLAGLAAVCPAPGATLLYWIDQCAPQDHSGCLPGDRQLAEWALEAWQAASARKLRLERTARMEDAHIRVLWANGSAGLYGETRPIRVKGAPGAEVYVLPAIAREGPSDPLLRETIVYLTCLHETGHALGLLHTAAFADIMYSFEYGGDIVEYFGRYRRRLATRADIRRHSGISPADRKQLLELWK